MTKFTGTYPKNLNIQGLLNFPLYNEQDLERVQAWRLRKGHPKPEFDDQIGGTLLLKPAMWDKAVAYLRDTHLPFVKTLYTETSGEKGIDPDLVDELLDQVINDRWTVGTGKKQKPNLPLRRLNARDIEDTTPEGADKSPYVGKLKFSGPYEGKPIEKSAIINVTPTNPGGDVVSLRELIDDGVIPESRADIDTLWWGANWNFRTNLRFNTYDKASTGTTAYAQKLYVLPHLGLPVSGGSDDAILEVDGDDWSDD